MDGQKGGVCTRFNMKIELKISNSKGMIQAKKLIEVEIGIYALQYKVALSRGFILEAFRLTLFKRIRQK